MCTFVSEGPSLYEYRTVQKTIVVGAGLWYGTKDDMAFLALKGGQKRQHSNGILTRVLLTKEDTLFAQCCWCGQPLYYFTSLQESWDEEISVGNIAHTKLPFVFRFVSLLLHLLPFLFLLLRKAAKARVPLSLSHLLTYSLTRARNRTNSFPSETTKGRLYWLYWCFDARPTFRKPFNDCASFF